MRLALLVCVAMIALRIVGVRWSSAPTALLPAIIASGVGIGFSVAVLFRGIFLRSLRKGGRSEGAVALWTGFCFRFFHIPTMFMGWLVFAVLGILASISIYSAD